MDTLLTLNNDMIFERDTGLLIKLYSDAQYNHYASLSDGLLNLLDTVLKLGYQMIEFDRDAQEYADLATFEW